MNILKTSRYLPKQQSFPEVEKTGNYLPVLLLGFLLILWPFVQRMVMGTDPTIGFIDPNIWLLILLSLISFLLFLGLSWWLLKVFWQAMDLPTIPHLVSQFKTLESWQQLSFFWASFALLLLTILGLVSAIL